MVKISELFEVKRGTCAAIDAYENGATPLVSASTYNQGVVGFVSAPEEKLFPAGSISVAVIGDGSSCFACLQSREFHASINTEVLIPRRQLSTHQLIAVAAWIRSSKWRFHYGRIVGGRLKNLELDEAVIERIASQVTLASPKPVALEAGVLQQVVDKLRELYGDSPTLGDVFELKQGKATAVAYLAETGNIPVVSATEKEVNAVAGYLFTSEEELMPAGSISVAKDGKPGVARMQPVPYRATEHALALIPKESWLNGERLVLAALIERQCWRFSFARAAGESRLSALNLLDGFLSSKPDFPQPNPISAQ